MERKLAVLFALANVGREALPRELPTDCDGSGARVLLYLANWV